MPYGFGGGFAAGLDSGLGHGTQIAEVQMRREALQQEKIKQSVETMQGYINDGLKNLSEIVSQSPQRDVKVESVIQNYQSSLTEAAQLMQKLGPTGEQAGKMALQTINNIIPNLQTQSEAFTAKRVGEVQGAFGAVDQLSGQPSTPAAAPPTMATSPTAGVQTAQMQGTPGVPTPADPTVPTQLGDGTAQANDVLSKFEQLGYSRKDAFEMMLTGKPPEKGDSEKIAQEAPARFAAIDQGIKALEKADPDTGIKYRELLSKPSTWNKAQALGVPGSVAGTELQLAKSAMAQALQGALYALTGAQINTVEDERISNLFMPSLIHDNDKSAAEKINRFYQFIGQAKQYAKTRKLEENPLSVAEALTVAGMDPMDAKDIAADYNEGGGGGQTQMADETTAGMGSSATAAPAQQFATEDEAAAAGLPDGTKVIINGVRGTWRN